MIEAVFLDVGGVVLQIDWVVSMEKLGFKDEVARGEALQRLFDWPLLHQFERGQIEPAEFFQEMNLLFGTKFSEIDLRHAWNDLILGELPKIHGIFDRFSARVPIYALSNTNVVHMEFMMNRYPVLKRFKQFFASNEMGHRKPEREIYQVAAKTAGVEPSKAIFIDDLQANVDAAKAVGFKAYRSVNSPEQTTLAISRHLE